eukprot:2258331-Pyramimonas_sp.AAC.1
MGRAGLSSAPKGPHVDSCPWKGPVSRIIRKNTRDDSCPWRGPVCRNIRKLPLNSCAGPRAVGAGGVSLLKASPGPTPSPGKTRASKSGPPCWAPALGGLDTGKHAVPARDHHVRYLLAFFL